jgi:homeobox protein ESX1
MPQIPGMPAMPAAPQMPTMHVEDLGKNMMQGHEVEGKRYTIQPPAMPQMPQAPQMPLKPGIPQPPQMPPKPQVPATAEVWTSPSLQLPMATRLNGSFGQQTTICRNAMPGEPNPAVFQIPHDYKQLLPPAPKPPATPQAPALPKFPG